MERHLTNTTKYIVKISSQPSYYDYGTLLEFYQPIIGPVACSLYMTLFSDVKNNINIEIKNPHSRIFTITQLNKNEFVNEMKLLESISLVKTYYKRINKEDIYVYELQPPKSHSQLLSDDTFMEVLNLKLSKRDVKYLFARWEQPNDKNGIEISEKLNNLSNVIFQEDDLDIKTTDMKIEFNVSLLNNFLEQHKINLSNFSDEDVQTIKILFGVYNIEYYKFALLINEVVEDNKIDIDKLKLIVKKEYDRKKNTLSKDSKLKTSTSKKISEKIKVFQEHNIADFVLNRTNVPATKEQLDIFNGMLNTYKVDFAIVNILIDFSLLKNGKIVIPYNEKIIKTMSDRNINNPLDAMNYLINANTATNNKNKKSSSKSTKKEFVEKEVDTKTNMITDDQEFEQIWEEMME